MASPGDGRDGAQEDEPDTRATDLLYSTSTATPDGDIEHNLSYIDADNDDDNRITAFAPTDKDDGRLSPAQLDALLAATGCTAADELAHGGMARDPATLPRNTNATLN